MKAEKGKKTKGIAEYGDFQTPASLAADACELIAKLGIRPRFVLEPTCGVGAFVSAAATAFPEACRVRGMELNPEHLAKAKTVCGDDSRVQLLNADFFGTDWERLLENAPEPWLILGNPPWVTSAELGTLGSDNLPEKRNFHGRSGIEAITGKSNFDISEWMMLRYLGWLRGRVGTIAVLCKTAVARKILVSAWRSNYPIKSARIYRIDALAQFGAAVDACFFVFETRLEKNGEVPCLLFDSLDAVSPSGSMSFIDNHLVLDEKSYRQYQNLLGRTDRHQWRSGIKHDCSKIMEFKVLDGQFVNGLGEQVDIESVHLYPLLKSSDVGNARVKSRNVMLVTQKFVGEDTVSMRTVAPRTWKYLEEHAEFLERRGSSIYRNKPRFSIFGVGPYSFAPWKVAISGFYKQLRFLRVGPEDGKPVVVDDTVNFLPCSSEEEASFIHEMLSSEPAQLFLSSMINWDEKRPITVELLRRLDLAELSRMLGQHRRYESLFAIARGPLFDGIAQDAA